MTATIDPTGTARPATSPDNIRVYTEPPPKYEVLGTVTGVAPTKYGKAGQDIAVQKMKVRAAEVGANGILITGTENDAWLGSQVQGKAIYVPPSK